MRTSARSAERRTRQSGSPAGPIGSWQSTFNPATIRLASCPTFCCIIAPCSKRHGLTVRTLLVLLHRGADSPRLTGLYERGVSGEPFDAALRYRVLRVWEVPAAAWLSGDSDSFRWPR